MSQIITHFKPRRYFFFAFELGCSLGGTEDLKGTFHTKEECILQAITVGWTCYQILDTETGDIEYIQ
jgi:hypothetical protein